MRSLSLYIHWPFCLAKCPYCDFNSHVREKIPQKYFAECLKKELIYEADRLHQNLDKTEKYHLKSIFFGGGTPSLMSAETVALLIETAQKLFTPSPLIEITLEANPTSVEAGKFEAFRQAGVNRLSLGIQSLEDNALKDLGRQHSAQQALNALTLGRKIFPRISFDLIYARPNQTQQQWRKELQQALELASDHLSLYQLTIEPGTYYETLYQRGDLILPSDDKAASLYHLTNEEAARYKLYPYEVSNYAQKGSESQHNLTYWRYGDYLGIGPGAHSRLTLQNQLYATKRHRAPEIWAEKVQKHHTGCTEETYLTTQERSKEALLMGLRLSEGISQHYFEERTGLPLLECLNSTILEACIEEEYLIYDGHRLRTTIEGRLRLETILSHLIL